MKGVFARSVVLFAVLAIIACGGLRYSQLDPAAGNYHPGRIAVFPADVGPHQEASPAVEQIAADILVQKKWFKGVLDVASLAELSAADNELGKAMTDYLSKLQTLSYSDPVLSQKIGELAKTDAFLLISVDYWNYYLKKDKNSGKVSLGLRLVDAPTGRIMWKAGHDKEEAYSFFQPKLDGIARSVLKTMFNEMPH